MEKQPIKPKQKKAPQISKGTNQSTKPAAIDSKKKRTFWLSILTAAAIGFGGWSLLPPAAPDADNLTQDEITQIQQNFDSLGTLEVNRITDPEEIKQAITSMGLSPEQNQQLEHQVSNDDLDIAWIQAWDNAAEDGDVLRFESANYKVTTTLVNKPVVFALPLSPGVNQVTVTGVHDGGGGITASVVTSSGAVSTPVIATGSVYTLSLR